MGLADTKNGVMEYSAVGDGAETLIIAAGLGRPASEYEDLAVRISKSGIRVVIYNYRGIGRSNGPLEGITLLDLAGDVLAIADELGVQQFHVAGKTFGNRVMRTASQHYPDRIQSVILIGAGGEIPPSKEIIELYQRYTSPEVSEEEWHELNRQLNYAPNNQHLAETALAHGMYPDVARHLMVASQSTKDTSWLMGGNAPMLVLTGLLDEIAVPENALSLGKKRANTWVIGIPNCGHNMIFEQPHEIAEHIVRFIQTNPVKHSD